MLCRLVVRLLALLLLITFSLTEASADQANDYFKQGVEAARRGDNQGAVRAFENAKRAGLATSALYYNLGVLYYRMKVYAWSEDYFYKLTSDKAYAALAYYNLGLIAASKDQITEAVRDFNTSYSMTHNPKLKALSELALRRLRLLSNAGSAQQPVSRGRGSVEDNPPWRGLLSLSIARDDNVGLDNDEVKSVTSISEKQDNYAEILATTHGYLSGNRQGGFSLTAYGNAQKYATPSISQVYDYSQYHIAFNRESATNFWQFKYGVGYDDSTFGGADFLRLYSVFIQTKRYFRGQKYLRLHLASYKIAADPLYQYLDGYKSQFKVDFTERDSSWKFRLYYSVELSNREDFRTTTTFRSYSPVRNTVALTAYFNMSSSWQTRAELQYRNSIYRSDDVLDSATNNSFLRKDNRYRFAASLIYNVTPHWQASIDYSFLKNDSNRVDLAGTQLSDYQRNLVSASLTWFY